MHYNEFYEYIYNALYGIERLSFLNNECSATLSANILVGKGYFHVLHPLLRYFTVSANNILLQFTLFVFSVNKMLFVAIFTCC